MPKLHDPRPDRLRIDGRAAGNDGPFRSMDYFFRKNNRIGTPVKRQCSRRRFSRKRS